MDDDPFLHPELTVPEQRVIADLAQLRNMSTPFLQTLLLDVQQELDRRVHAEGQPGT